MISLLVTLIVFGFLLWLVTLIPMAPPVKQIVVGVAVLLLVLWLLNVLFGVGGGDMFQLRGFHR